MVGQEDGYCGLYCGACPIFMQTNDGNLDPLVAEIGLPLEDITCYGCKSDQVAKWCRECNLKKCARAKGYNTCIECEEYPCAGLIGFRDDPRYPYHVETENYLDQIKNEGLDTWLTSMKVRWACPRCQTPYNWWQQICNNCGSTLEGYKKPDS